ncbi:MAG: L-type lectin-domain containing protein [Bacteroidota bacterium]
MKSSKTLSLVIPKMNPMKMACRQLILALFVLASFTLSAQSDVKDFRLGASASILNDECIRLTPDLPYASGSAWYEKPIDLSGPFEMVVCLVLGEKDGEGADGIAFVFHPTMRTGWRGEGMGFSGLAPSLGIEFDTYQNYHLADPEADHLAIMPNGQAYHGFSLLGPINLANLEDGEKHLLRITWDPLKQELRVELDNEERALLKADIINGIFEGNSIVYWGVTAATGRLSNYQDICIKKLVYAGVEK